jgi:exodeoxyribonuclease III
MLGILTVNIGAAALPRGTALHEWLSTRTEDVFVLTETSSGAGTGHLCDEFRRAGWHVLHEPDSGGDRGVALFSKVAILENHFLSRAAVTLPGRVVSAVLDTHPRVGVVGVYVPSRDRSVDKVDKKQRFIDTWLSALSSLPLETAQSMVVTGDYNVIARHHVPRHSGFLPFEYALLDNLEALGLADVHDHLTPGAVEYSWVGRTGDGYRYDYMHVGHALMSRARSCRYLHETRAQRLTDHSALTMELAMDRVNWTSSREVERVDEQAALF